jgi:hypothetical protein
MFRSILVALVAALFIAGPALADRDSCQLVSNALDPTEAGATNDIINLADGTFGTSHNSDDEFMVPVRVEATDLYLEIDVAPGAGDIWVATLYADSVATGLTASISGTAIFGQSGTSGATIPAGADLTLLLDSSTGATDPAAAAEIRFAFCLTSK